MRYYVYQLIDPRDGQVFYIGKGTGNRWRQHLHNRKPRGRPNPGNWMKAYVLAGLRAAGLEPECRKIGLFVDSAAAYRFESECIAEAKRDGVVLTNYNDGIRL